MPGSSFTLGCDAVPSKVTIDFDGSELRENVRVYLKEARIYDIPKECTLGFGLKSDSDGGNYNNAAGKDGIFTASEPRLTNAIIYGEGMTIRRGRPSPRVHPMVHI